MKIIKYFFVLTLLVSTHVHAQKRPVASEVLQTIQKVNEHWQATHPKHERAFWDNAAYHTGNMEAYFLTKNESYRQYSEAWAEQNLWMGAKSDNKTNWKYSYGETDDYVLFGDWQICFQTYIDLNNLKPESRKIARAIEVMEYEMSTPNKDYWWWSDGLYMVMPVMTKLYKATGNKQYLEKLYEYFTYANSIMYDAEEGLYYRDAKYVYPKHKSTNGKKDFWARGDGWVFAALAKVLKDLPTDDPHREEYLSKYKKMAESIIKIQQKEGYWTRSMLDAEHAPGPETSGTAFFTYGLLWGINNGYLKEKHISLLSGKPGHIFPRLRYSLTEPLDMCSQLVKKQFRDRLSMRSPPLILVLGRFCWPVVRCTAIWTKRETVNNGSCLYNFMNIIV